MKRLAVMGFALLALSAGIWAFSPVLAPAQERFLAQTQDVLPLTEILDRVMKRYKGTVIDADIAPPKKKERGAAIYEVRLLTENGNVIRIRLDARSGDFLSVDGHGFLEALRP
jgi:uncharacterized membrane protein YkoI